jgi:hypothetical protein
LRGVYLRVDIQGDQYRISSVNKISSPGMSPTPTYNHGVRVAAVCNSVLLVWLYAVVAPTRDIRARIPFLLDIFDGVAWLEFIAIGMLAGFVGLFITGGWSRKAVIGVAVGALLSVMVLDSGLIGWLIPAGYDSPPKYWLLGVAVVVTGVALWRARRQLRRANDPRAEVASA